ncbi:CAF17-like 4Fe-4S cluster assembly/insertion protein YgfZ [Gulosibacter bifidus]|uniref:YgfZ/GcvT domain-containing protein n=1 Tax=Gulosibacter bifidus TaxID=272239 RepID=A0ABW5RH34_9MICO|nr:folate-binding protein YgfZ [Gulosibacter bifidus]
MTTPLAQQRALANGAASVLLPNIGAVAISGPDRLKLIHSLTTQHVANLPAGESVENLVLSPQGRIEHQFGMIDDGDRAVLFSETATALGDWFNRMRFMMRVEIAALSGQVVGSFADAADAATQFGASVSWRDPWAEATGLSYASQPYGGAAYPLTLHLVDTPPADALDAATLTPLRIAAWRPQFSTEVDDRALPHELDLLRSAVHLNKGCYRGQETVAKVHNLGHPPRRLAFLHLDGFVPASGALVRLEPEGKPVGRITSAAMHYEDGPIALALLKRTTNPGAVLCVDDADAPITASQTVIVSPDAGRTVQLPPRR